MNNLTRLIEKYEQSTEYYKNSKNAYNEHSCRDEYINPLLEALGWDVYNEKGKLPQYREVIVENYSNLSDRPDYSLTLNGVTKIFVEAKKPAVDITAEAEPSIQTRKYGWNARHKLAVLTNFEYLLIYDTTVKPEEGDRPDASLYKKYYYKEYEERFDEIYSLISREAVYTGAFDAFTEDHFTGRGGYRKEVDDTFLEQINQWRVSLGNHLYSQDEKFRDIKVLNDTVQEFINQIIFLRICEDKNLPLYASLKEISDRFQMKEALDKAFREADKEYGAGLFQGDNIIFNLDNWIIMDIIEKLYYPKTPYLFQIIEPSILGKIYEAFLAEHLTLAGGTETGGLTGASVFSLQGKIELAKKKEYKFRSVVATPVEIVKYMVKHTLTDRLKGREPKEILNLRIADIACGSGVFLEEAYQFLLDYCIVWYEENRPDHLIELSNGRKKLPLEEKRALLLHCIYGVDIDIHAVEVAKFSLFLKLMEDETKPSVEGYAPILPSLDDNFCHGNALLGPDELTGFDLSLEDLLELVPFDWKEINNGQDFDIILGNPPYVSTEDMHTLLTEGEFKAYKKLYTTAHKQFDKYYLFVERGLKRLKTDGSLCYIIPNKFYKIASGQELRSLIGSRISGMDDFGDAQLFPDKTIYCAIVTLDNRGSREMDYRTADCAAALWGEENRDCIRISNSSLTKEPWRLSSDMDFLKLIRRAEKRSVPLSRVCHIFNGIQTSAERPQPVYWFDEGDILEEAGNYIRVYRNEKEYRIEKALLKPYFKPTKAQEKGMDTYTRLKTGKRIIFPYEADGSLISIERMQMEFSGTYAYLLDFYDRLVPRCLNNGVGRDIPGAGEKTWYQYGRCQALTAFVNTPKLIVRVLSKEPMYAYDREDMLIASGGTAGYCAVSEKKDSPYSLFYIQAWLNHPYTEKLLKMLGSDFENGFTARGTFVLSKLPFVPLDFEHREQRALYDLVVKRTGKIYEINEALETNQDKGARGILNKEKKMLILEIEKLIGMVYEQKF